MTVNARVPNEGDFLGGSRYEVERVLSAPSASAWSVRARRIDDDRPVVIKARQHPLGEGELTLPQWRDSAVVSYIETFNEDGGGRLVAEWVNGASLPDALKAKQLKPGNRMLRELARQALTGLEIAHEANFLHLDLKPDNIVVAQSKADESETFQATLVDFGFWQEAGAKLEAGDSHPTLFGSIYCMAPELFDKKPAHPGSDLYALGCCLYTVACSRFPFEGDSNFDIMLGHLSGDYSPVHDLNPRVEPKLAELVERLLSRSPAERPASAREAGELLR